MFKTVVVGISGGVDSAVTAFLLKNRGFTVIGAFMKNWDIIDETGTCRAEEDYEDAEWVCKKLKIPLVKISFVKEYWNSVFSDLLEKYQSGWTPNPDILCNKNIKFDQFFNFAQNHLNADAIATGHYVRTSFGCYLENYKSDQNVHLLQAHDTGKDQTFFLCQVSQKSLRRCMFPLGKYNKQYVKKLARDIGLDFIANKRESMGICFIGKRQFKDFISEYIEDKPGKFIDLDSGIVVGTHQGIHHWTVGQRCRSLAITHKAFFVYHKDIQTNNIIVVDSTDHPALYTNWIITEIPHWIAEEPQELKYRNTVLRCYFRFQHRKPLISCNVVKMKNNKLLIKLDRPLRAITKGQYAIYYKGEECLGGAEITYPGPSYFLQNLTLPNIENKNNNKTYKLSINTNI